MSKRYIYLYEEENKNNEESNKPNQSADARYSGYKNSQTGVNTMSSDQIKTERKKEQRYAIYHGKEMGKSIRNAGFLLKSSGKQEQKENQQEKNDEAKAKASTLASSGSNTVQQNANKKGKKGKKGKVQLNSAPILDEENEDNLIIDNLSADEHNQKLQDKDIVNGSNKQPLQEILNMCRFLGA